jgi:hypothetical protein
MYLQNTLELYFSSNVVNKHGKKPFPKGFFLYEKLRVKLKWHRGLLL